jgi:hypothetical protein
VSRQRFDRLTRAGEQRLHAVCDARMAAEAVLYWSTQALHRVILATLAEGGESLDQRQPHDGHQPRARRHGESVSRVGVVHCGADLVLAVDVRAITVKYQ